MTLSRDQALAVVLAVLGGIAPEADLAALAPQANLRRALDLDSVDFQNFLIGLVKATGVDIADRAAASLVTLDACVAHLTGRPTSPDPRAGAAGVESRAGGATL